MSRIFRKHWLFNGSLFQSNCPGMPMKEVWKKKIEKKTSKEVVITSILEKDDSLTTGLLHMKKDSSLSERDQDDGR